MARVISVNRASKKLVSRLNVVMPVTGWALELDQSVDWDMISSNYGPRAMRIARCISGGEYFQIIELLNAPVVAEGSGVKIRTFKPDDEQFFIAEIQNDDGSWNICDGSEGHSSIELTNGRNACACKWSTPQWYQCNMIAH